MVGGIMFPMHVPIECMYISRGGLSVQMFAPRCVCARSFFCQGRVFVAKVWRPEQYLREVGDQHLSPQTLVTQLEAAEEKTATL